jgi:hypothetical protein
MNAPLPAEIFKAYDIRGIVGKTLTADIVRRIGHGLGSLAVERGQRRSPSAATDACRDPNCRRRLMEGIRWPASTPSMSAACRHRRSTLRPRTGLPELRVPSPAATIRRTTTA